MQHNSGVTVTIWIDDGQLQCCGEGFAPGDVVSWNLLEVGPEDFADVVGGDRAAEIDFREEHHGDGDPPPTRLKVLTVTEVHCRYAASSPLTDMSVCRSKAPGGAR
ncbi:DUF6578 domain-containing protein [Streptomyces sp. NPDC046859]|uniref:DUF6578 domain-containing protein n=1 Tax=Streptomyces sp. NPDC046859 TaxID=3155734 RepID=UPI00340EB90E